MSTRRPNNRKDLRSTSFGQPAACVPLPSEIGPIAYQNKATVYGLLFPAAPETLTTIAADPKHLGAAIGVTTVVRTWGQNLDHHSHVHCIVPGSGHPAHRQLI